MLIANSNLVGKWAMWEHFRELERKGLMMYGQMTAGSWIYIGSQGIVQGTFETFAAAAQARTSTAPTSPGRVVLSAASAGRAARSRSPRRWPAACTSARSQTSIAARIQRRLETRVISTVLAPDLDSCPAPGRRSVARPRSRHA